MDEVASSSSSSIGREENANQIFNGGTGGAHKMKNQLFQEVTGAGGGNRDKQALNEDNANYESKSRLNFTGLPFSNDSIFMQSGFDHNFGELEESIIDRMAIEVPKTAKPKEVSVRF